MTDDKLVQTLLVHAETALEEADRRLPPGATVTRYGALQIAIEDALPRIEAHYREKLEARLMGDGAEALAALIYEAQRTYSQPTWDAPEPPSGRSWLTPHRRDYYRGRARKYLLAALQVDEETTP